MRDPMSPSDRDLIDSRRLPFVSPDAQNTLFDGTPPTKTGWELGSLLLCDVNIGGVPIRVGQPDKVWINQVWAVGFYDGTVLVGTPGQPDCDVYEDVIECLTCDTPGWELDPCTWESSSLTRGTKSEMRVWEYVADEWWPPRRPSGQWGAGAIS